jgi:hypothetical protein
LFVHGELQQQRSFYFGAIQAVVVEFERVNTTQRKFLDSRRKLTKSKFVDATKREHTKPQRFDVAFKERIHFTTFV